LEPFIPKFKPDKLFASFMEDNITWFLSGLLEEKPSPENSRKQAQLSLLIGLIVLTVVFPSKRPPPVTVFDALLTRAGLLSMLIKGLTTPDN
jgi:hypothetical protein